MIGKMKRAFLVPSAIVIYGALALSWSCGGDDEPDEGGTTGGGAQGGAAGGGDGGDCDPTPKPYVTKTVDATNTDMIVPNVKVEVVDDETGQPLSPPVTATSNGAGAVTLMVNPCKKFGIKAYAVPGSHTDTYSYHARQEVSGQADALVRMGSENASSLVPISASYPVLDDRAPAAGAVYWRKKGEQYYDVVGCAQIEYEGGEIPTDWELRYFKEALPSSKADWPLMKGTRDRDGRFFVGNAPPGKHTFIAKVGGNKIGEADIMIFPRTTGSTSVAGHPAVLFLAGIYIDAEANETNPTPANCAAMQQ